MKLKDLLEKRSRTVSDMRAITDNPAGDGGDISTEQATKFDALKTELAGVDKQIERQRLIDEAERRMQGDTIAGTGDGRLDTALEGFSIRRAMLSQVPGHNEDCGRERELSHEIARRAGRPFQGIAVPLAVLNRKAETRVMTTAAPVGGPGGNLIATDHRGDLYIDALRAEMFIRRLGARVVTGLVGNVDIPKLTESATVGWVAENSALTPSDQEHDPVELRPKSVGGIVEFSRNLLLQTSPDIEALIRMDFAQVIARAADAAAIAGTGTNQPVGIMETEGVNSSVSFATPSWAKVLELIEAVENSDAAGNAFAMHPKVVRKLRSTLRAADTDSRMVMDGARELADYPAAVSTLLPLTGTNLDGSIIFGNWSDLIMAFWSELDILVNPYESTAYTKGNVQVRAMATADIALRHPESFAFADDVDLSNGA